jgi:hypothetical protein
MVHFVDGRIESDGSNPHPVEVKLPATTAGTS